MIHIILLLYTIPIFNGVRGCPDFNVTKYTIIETDRGESIWYGTVKGKHDYASAERECQEIDHGDSHLAIFKSKGDYQHIEEAAKKTGIGSATEFWLSGKGPTGRKLKGHGGQVPYRKWLNRQPDQSGGNTNCLAVANAKWAKGKAGKFYMDDKDCGRKLRVLCQTRNFEGCPGSETKQNRGAEEAGGNGGGGVACFAGDTVVQAQRGPIQVKDLVVGDKILTRLNSMNIYVNVETWLHRDPDMKARFIQLRTANNRTLSVTTKHLLLVLKRCDRERSETETIEDKVVVTAENVRAGMCVIANNGGVVEVDPVIAISSYIGTGVYAPLTMRYMFANDILTSCHSDGAGDLNLNGSTIKDILISISKIKRYFKMNSSIQSILDYSQDLVISTMTKIAIVTK